MELALNATWFAIALASYCLLWRWLGARVESRKERFNAVQCAVALTCVLAILFPVISLSDDLQDLSATAEDAASARILFKRFCSDGRISHFVPPSHRGRAALVPGRLRFAQSFRRRSEKGRVTGQVREIDKSISSRPPPSSVAAA